MKLMPLFFTLLIVGTAFSEKTNKKNTPYAIMLQKRAEILGIPEAKPLSNLEIATQKLNELQKNLDELNQQFKTL